MIDEIQRQEFWNKKTTITDNLSLDKKEMTAFIEKLYYTNNETNLCIHGWIIYNGRTFNSSKPLLKIDLNTEKPTWFIYINHNHTEIIEDETFKKLVCEGIENYVSQKKHMLQKLRS